MAATQQEIDEATAKLEAARAARQQSNTAENREAFQNAWNALEAITPRRKGRGGFPCRAGARQHREMEAERQEALRRRGGGR